MAEQDRKEGFIEELVECHFCAGFIPDEFKCILCGEDLLDTEMTTRTKTVCSNCRTDVNEDAEECLNCGTAFT